MSDLNTTSLTGRVTEKPQVRQAGPEHRVATVTIASNRVFGSGESAATETLFLDCEVWEKRADWAATHLDVGTSIWVTGRLVLNQWEDKKDGSKRSKVVLRVEDIGFCGAKKQG